MRHLIPSLTYLLLSSPITGSLAARPCPSPASPIQWTASEWTYDAPDPTGRGRAALDSVVGLYLVVGGVDFSCFGSWPEPREGFADEEGRALVWFSCVVNRGRMVDDTVSFAVDWRNNNRTLYAAHSFVCSDGDRKGLSKAAIGSIPLRDLTCETSTSTNKPTRCITTARQLSIATHPDDAAPNPNNPKQPQSCVADASQLVAWEVRDFAPLSALASASASPPERASTPGSLLLFSVRDVSSNLTVGCKLVSDGGVPLGGERKVVEGSCSSTSSSSVGESAGEDGIGDGDGAVKFSFDTELRVLSLARELRGCGTGDVLGVARGAAYVPLPCSSILCEEGAVFWVGGKTSWS